MDIALAAAVRTVCGGAPLPTAGDEDAADAGPCVDGESGGDAYVPGAIRERWLASTPASAERRQVLALASAGASALSTLSADALNDTARRYGVPLDATTAAEIAAYFAARRDAVLTYDR